MCIEPVCEAVEKSTVGLKRKKVLVMDDEEMIRNICGQMLSYLGYEVVLSKDGAEAIEAYEKAMKSGKPFDVVILDLTVRGGIGGKETISKLVEIDPSANCIASSGYPDDPAMMAFERYGFKRAIAKPFGLNGLGEVLQEVITGNIK